MNAHAAVVGLVLTALAAAQQDLQRGALAGWVKGADGNRVVGAAVTLVSRPIPARLDLGTTDELHVATGHNGMFRAELLHGRSYTAWATWRDAAGVEQRTGVLEAVFPGPPHELTMAPLQELRRLRVEGMAAWGARAPLSCALFPEGENPVAVPLVIDAEGRALLPTLPGRYCQVEVRGRDGFLIALSPDLYLAEGGRAEATLVLPPPRELRVRVIDDQQQPVVGARVWHSLVYHRRDVQSEIGRTDAEGRVCNLVAATDLAYTRDNFSVVVEAAGHQRQVAFCSWQKLTEELVFTLPAGIALRGRLLAKDGGPVQGITLLPDCYAIGRDNETLGSGVWLRPCALDGDGRFTFHSLHPRYDFRLLATMEPAAAIAAGLALRPDVAIAPVLWLAVGRPPFGGALDLGDVRFDRFVVTCIEVKDFGGTPVPGARLEITTQDLYNSPLPYVTDRVGRLQFVLPSGELRIGAWVPGGGVATRLVNVPPLDGEPSLVPLVLTLSATWTVRGVVVDEAGKPVAGATVSQYDRARIEDRALRNLTFFGRATSEPTGVDGRFVLTLPLADAPFAIRAWKKVGDAAFHGEHVVMPEDADAQTLRLQLAPWQPRK